MALSKERIEELREQLEAQYSTPWHADGRKLCNPETYISEFAAPDMAAFIAGLVNDAEDLLDSAERVSELEAKLAELKFDRRDAVLSVIGDLRKQIDAHLCLGPRERKWFCGELDYYVERVETWSEPRPEVAELEAYVVELQVQVRKLEAKLAAAKELIDELRGYCSSWDYKYGRGWDEQRKALE